MLVRIVRMTFEPRYVSAFLVLFHESAPRIRQQPGCRHLELWQDADHPATYCTHSHWDDAAALNAYRKSTLFGEVWPATKRLFAAPPVAFSVNPVLYPYTYSQHLPVFPMPDPSDYFAFYDLPHSFRPDEAALKRLYYAKSRETHPDFHATSSPENQAEMLRQATLNTDAYRTLSDPDKRMAYILRENGLLEEGKKEQLPPDFLMDMMELNEQLMDLEMDADPAGITKVAAEVQALADTLDAGIEPVLAGYEQLPADHRPAALQQIRTYYLKKRYLLRIQQQLATFAARS
ncbi:antibiotic biosynthesis monooxygenase [Hymenobacter rubidus]|uniref:antibiotic biosynthesis monooxygenase n=1 Tax=Hymenobacter rubidus TaxID=1441626 RepID=UPI00293D2F72|nr:antibiotic biosynthesis monooxygenase [Hymenobacter rubidus]